MFTEEGAPVARVVSVPYLHICEERPQANRENVLLPQVPALITVEQGSML